MEKQGNGKNGGNIHNDGYEFDDLDLESTVGDGTFCNPI
jgi:hypothetical protein